MLERLQEVAHRASQSTEGATLVGRVSKVEAQDGNPICSVDIRGRRGQTYTLVDVASAIPVQVGHLVFVTLVNGDTSRENYITGYARPPVPQSVSAQSEDMAQGKFFGGDNPWNVGSLIVPVVPADFLLSDITLSNAPSGSNGRDLVPDFDVQRQNYVLTTSDNEVAVACTLSPSGMGAENLRILSIVRHNDGTGRSIEYDNNHSAVVPLRFNAQLIDNFNVFVAAELDMGTPLHRFVFQIYRFNVIGYDNLFKSRYNAGYNIAQRFLSPGDRTVGFYGYFNAPGSVPSDSYRREFAEDAVITITSKDMLFSCVWVASSITGKSISHVSDYENPVRSPGAFFRAIRGLVTDRSESGGAAPITALQWRFWVVLEILDDDEVPTGDMVVGDADFHTGTPGLTDYPESVRPASFQDNDGEAKSNIYTGLDIAHRWTVRFDAPEHVGKKARVKLYIQNRFGAWHLTLDIVGSDFSILDFSPDEQFVGTQEPLWRFQMREIGVGSGL